MKEAPLFTTVCAKIALIFDEEKLTSSQIEYLTQYLLPEFVKKYSGIRLNDQQKTELKMLSAGVKDE